MAISSVTMTAGAVWVSTQTNTGFDDAEQRGSISSKVSPTVASGSNRKYSTTLSLAAAASQTLDLQSLTDVIDGAIVATKIYGIIVTTEGSSCKVAKGASNGLEWVFGSSAWEVTIPANSHMAIGCATNGTVDATHKTIDISNPGGSTLTAKVVLILGQ